MSGLGDPDVPSLAIIGGGIFGLTAAIEAAQLQVEVSVFDRNAEIVQGATKMNTGVIHLGYHYPRSMETVLQSKRGQVKFQSRFSDCIMSTFDKYYCVASEGSLTGARNYLEFCEQNQLPFSVEFPPDPFLNKKKVELSIRVPEGVFDYRRLRERLLEQLRSFDNVSLLRRHEVVRASLSNHNRKALDFVCNATLMRREFDFVLNASYANTNFINSFFGAEPFDLQYELSEFIVISIPWHADHPIGVTVMDGPFCSLNPFGFSNFYSIGHVDSTIRKRSIGHYPSFDCQESPGNRCRWESGRRVLGDCDLCDAKPATNYAELVGKSAIFFPILAQCRHERSYFVMRCVLANRDHDDARPTLVQYMGSGVWTVFGGKVDTSLDAAEEFRNSLKAQLL
ncbi:MAG: FAD-dependent oxidoreductase [Acidobacteria bacterium]|nr:FAD-dependent oxidoreductase [Acidobacteriota bacterium]